MDYIITTAIAAGGIWTGYLVGQFVSIKDTNRRLNVLLQDRDAYRESTIYWAEECDRMAEVIGKHQDKAHKCDKCNQFASKRKAKTAELQAYVASKKAVQ